VIESEGLRATGISGSDFERQAVAQTPLGRTGRPQDIAPAVVFLASAESAFITGETLSITGGYDELSTSSRRRGTPPGGGLPVGLQTPTVCSMRSLTFRMTDSGSGSQQATERPFSMEPTGLGPDSGVLRSHRHAQVGRCTLPASVRNPAGDVTEAGYAPGPPWVTWHGV
jgi:hypothetical protein